MAIKFSQFNLRTDRTAGMHLVGYDGNQNIHITVDNLFDDFINGTENTIAMFGTGGTVLADSILSQNAGATILTVAGQLNVDAAATFDTSITVTGDSALNGNVTLGNASTDLITQTGTLYLNGPLKDTTNTLGAVDQVLLSDASGELTFTDLAELHVGGAEVVEVPVKNVQGSALVKGDPVYISGSVGASGRLEVQLADASNALKMPAVGLLKQDLANNAEGFAVVTGKLRNLITDPIDGVNPTENDVVYVKPSGTSGAALTTAKPVYGNFIQNIGKVGRVSTSNDGNLVVSSILRTNDIPNLTPGRLWVGSTGNTIESQTLFVDEANGGLGVGTSSPFAKLHIKDEVNNPGIMVESSQATGANFQNSYINLRAAETSTSTTATAIISMHGVNTLNAAGPKTLQIRNLSLGGADVLITTYDNTNTALNPARFKSSGQVQFEEYGSSTFTGTAAYNLSVDSSGNIIETAAVPANIVETVTTTDGTYINLTPNSATDGAVTITADLSATGTPDATKYLRGDNTWSAISGIYAWDISDGTNSETILNGDTVTFAAGTNVTTLYTPANNTLTINSTDQYTGTVTSVGGTGTVNGLTLTGTVTTSGNLTLGGTLSINNSDWSGADLSVANGGTGLSSYTAGDILYASNTTTLAKLAIGSAGQVLKVNGGIPSWQTDSNSGGTVTSVATTAPITGGTITDSGTIGITQATTSANGYLSSTDWNTFNNKQSAITNPVTGTGTATRVAFWNSDSSISSDADLYWDNTNNRLGIGTTSPSSPLHVNSTGVTTLRISTSSSSSEPQILLIDGASDYFSIQKVDQGITFKPQGSEAMRIDSSGNVGIGTTSPSFKFDVVGDGIRNIRSTAGWAGWFQNNASSSGVIITAGVDSGDAPLLVRKQDTTEIFSVRGNGTSYFQNGNVGIGTTSPGAKLDVNGGIRLGQYNTLQWGSNTSNQLEIQNALSGSTITQLGSGDLELNSASNGIVFKAAGATKAKLLSSGNFGIGTTLPGQKLEVDGNILLQNNDEIRFKDSGGTERTAIELDPSNNFNIGTSAGGNLRFINGSSYTERMRIGSAGQIGIGGANYGTSGQVLTSNGSSSAPSWQDAGSGSSNWTLSGNDIYNNNSGNVGIGTSSPQQLLSIQDTSNNAYLHCVAGTSNLGGVWVGDSGSDYVGGFLYDNGQNASYFYTNGSERMRIDSSGRLGLGTSSPSNGKLQIDSTGNQISIETGTSGDGRLHIGHFANGTFIGTYGDDGGAADIIRFGTHSGDERMRIDSSGDLTVQGGRIYLKESDLGNNAVVITRDADEGYLQLFSSGSQTVELRGNGDSYINTGSNFGIGTSSPSQRLTVDGNIQATGARHVAALYDSNHYMRIEANSSGGVMKGIDGGVVTTLVRSYGDSYFNGGNVGIGTTSPSDKLHISDGNLRVQSTASNQRGVRIKANGEIQQTSSAADWLHLQRNHNGQVAIGHESTANLYVANNVGIGTTSPSQKLDVNGNVTANRYYGTGSTTYYVDPNDTSQAAYFAGDIRITDQATATIKLDSTSTYPGASIVATKNGSESPPMGTITWVENPGFQGSTWAQRLTNSPYTESSIKLPTSSSYNFAIKTLGSDRMVINSSGNVGIGTTSPLDLLHIKSSTTDARMILDGASGSDAELKFYEDGNAKYTVGYDSASANFVIGTANVDTNQRLVIGSAGQIGIGGANYGTSGQVLTSNGSSSAPSWQTPSTGDITGVTAGSYMTGGGTSGTVTLNANASVNATANTLAARTSSGDIYARLLRATYQNQSTISGAIAFRVNNGTDNYTRYCSSPAAIRSFIGAGTGSGDITGVTAGDYLSGGATSGNATVNLDVGGSGNWWGKGAAVASNGVMEVGKYIDFHDTNTATSDYDYRLTSSGGRLYLSGDLEVDGGDIYINDSNTRITEGAGNAVRLQSNHGYIDVGPQSASFCHITTDRPVFYFNKELQVDTGVVRSYNEDLNLNRAGSTTARLRITSGTTISDQALQSASTVRSQFNSGDYAQLESNGSGGVIKAVSSTSTKVLFRSYGDSYILNDLGIGTTSPSARLHVEGTTSTTSSGVVRLKSLTSSNGPYIRMIDFIRSNNSLRGYIALNPYAVQYSTSSDYRLKRNVTPMENSIDRIKLLKPSRFNWVEGPDDYVVDGFMAHEVQDVVHDAVSGEKDAVDENNEPAYQGIDQSKLVPLLTAALQDAIAKIENLETRIQTLENN